MASTDRQSRPTLRVGLGSAEAADAPCRPRVTASSEGALARAALEESLRPGPGSWPWATFVVNLLAAGLLGFAVAWLGEHHPRAMYGRAFLATGVCGALSTFSTVMIELIHLYEHAGLGFACAYAGASVAGGFAALALGMTIAARRSTRV